MKACTDTYDGVLQQYPDAVNRNVKLLSWDMWNDCYSWAGNPELPVTCSFIIRIRLMDGEKIQDFGKRKAVSAELTGKQWSTLP